MCGHVDENMLFFSFGVMILISSSANETGVVLCSSILWRLIEGGECFLGCVIEYFLIYRLLAYMRSILVNGTPFRVTVDY